MAKYYYYPYKKSYKKYGKYWKRGYGWKKGVSRASTQGTRRNVVRIPFNTDTQFSFSSNGKWSDVLELMACNSASVTAETALPQQPIFRKYTELFDECRVVSMKLKMILSSEVISTGAFMDVVTAVDRNCGDADLSNSMTKDEINAGSSAQRTTCGYSSKMTLYRSVYARDLQERTTFFDCTLAQNDGHYYCPDWINKEDSFRPCYFAICYKSSSVSGAMTVRARVEGEYVVQFRNPKLAIPSAKETFGDMKAAVLDEIKDDEVSVGAKKFDELSDAEKAKIMELVGSMGE